jgi:hypothetical protein
MDRGGGFADATFEASNSNNHGSRSDERGPIAVG